MRLWRCNFTGTSAIWPKVSRHEPNGCVCVTIEHQLIVTSFYKSVSILILTLQFHILLYIIVKVNLLYFLLVQNFFPCLLILLVTFSFSIYLLFFFFFFLHFFLFQLLSLVITCFFLDPTLWCLTWQFTVYVQKIWRLFVTNYRAAPFFGGVQQLESAYFSRKWIILRRVYFPGISFVILIIWG